MNDNERKIKIDELNELRKKIIDNYNADKYDFKDNLDTGSTNSSSKIKVLNNGKYKGTTDDNTYPVDYKNAGAINVLILAIITFTFESLFLLLSFIIFE